jgi:redox-sensitive bicupin YhaK (pirin superfamily)
MTLMRGEVEKGKSVSIELPETFNIILYLLDGSLTVNGSKAKAKDMLVFEPGQGGLDIQADETTRFIILSGEPLNEKVTSYGPFVMNNQTQIMEALRDAQTGKMGILIEEF